VRDARPAEVLILTGPPGAGKSTIAHELAATSQVPAVHLHSDDFWGSIKRGLIPPYLPESHDQNQIVVDAVCAAARVYAKGGYFVVLDGIVGPWFVGRVRAAIDVPLHYIVLRPDIEVTLYRAKTRTADRLKHSGPISNLHRQFSNLGEFEPYALDTSGHTIQQTLEAVRQALAEGTFRLPTTTPLDV
jgi:chloramphenicol 3-O-phosphotransferase